MSDGPSLYINPKRYRYGSDASPVEPEISLSTFMPWIELQPLSTVTGMLEIIGNTLYRHGRFAEGSEIKHVVQELRGTAR